MNKPFAVVPCCVFTKLYPDRKLNGKLVTTYKVRTFSNAQELIEYYKSLNPNIKQAFLGSEGRNVILYFNPDVVEQALAESRDSPQMD
jgi:hypothetical protein